MPSDYDQIRAENLQEYGHGTRHLAFLGTLYPDRTHFLFELLQNAEDAGARSIRFRLYNDRLEVYHNGRPFSEKDVRGLCGVGEGTKADDLTKIGRFGVGFKSVYAYTATPEIHSGDEHFTISDFVRPFPTAPRTLEKAWTTIFIFPFDRAEVPSAQAFTEISKGLAALSARTLLFLRSIDEVEWIIERGTQGCYLRDEKSRAPARCVTIVSQCDNKTVDEETWLIFTRSISLSNTDRVTSVEIAFQLKDGEKGGPAAIRPAKDSPLVAFFPTEKETHLGFLIQGPYRTTPARDNIPSNDSWNQQLVEETATLVVDALTYLKDMRLLTVSVLEAMPIRLSDFPTDGMFRPIYDAVRKALQEQSLLPGYERDSHFVSAKDAKLARSTDLMGLFYPQQLGPLFEHGDHLYWLTAEISENRTPELFRYVVGFSGRYTGDTAAIEPLIKDVLVTPETVARRITERFLSKRRDIWMMNLYGFFGKQPGIWSLLRGKSFVRLEDGSHVTPFQQNGQPNAYLPSMSSSGFPTLKREIAADESALKFLRDFGLKEPSMLSEVLHNILPKYASSEIDVEGDENREDIHKMCRAMRESNQEDRALLIEKMGAMHFVLASDAIGNARYVRPVEAYVSTLELEEYFEGNPDSYFLDEKYDEASVEFLCELGASKHVRIFRQESLFGVTTVVAGREHQRFQNGFDPNCMIDGLQYAFDNNTMSKAEYIWNHLLLPNIHLIRGVVESDTRQTFNSSNYRRAMHKSRMGEFVTTRAWLPDQEGVFYKSDELSLENLPDSFLRNEDLASALAMRSPESKLAADERAEVEAAAQKLGVSIEDTEWIRHNQDEFQLFKEDLERKRQREQTHSASQGDAIGHSLTGFVESLQSAFDKPNRYSARDTQVSPGNVRNPALRRERTHEEIEQALLEEPARAQRFKRVDSQVWEAKDNTVRAFLREQYAGHCQICDKTFLKRDGEPYFEGLYLVSQTHARWVNRSGNVLSVCANCCAKFQHGAVEVDSIIEQIQAIRLLREGGEGKSSLRIRLCDKDVLIQFTEAHILDLQEIVRLSSNDA